MRMRLLAEEFLQSDPTISLYMYIYTHIHTPNVIHYEILIYAMQQTVNIFIQAE